MDVFVVQLRKAMFLKGWRQIDLVRAIADQTARDRASIALYFANNLAL